jgi:cytochrome c biogenesis protein CcdA
MHSLLSIGIHLSLINARNASPQDTVTKMLCCLRRNLVTKQAGCQVVIGAVLVSSLTAAPGLSRFLQKYMGKLVGPIMIILGMFLLTADFRNRGEPGQKSTRKDQEQSLLGALILGSLFVPYILPCNRLPCSLEV